MADEDVQHAGSERAVLILLTPYTRGRVHERRERTVSAADRPHSSELLRIERCALAHQADGGGHVAGFLNRRLEARAEDVRLRIVVTPDTPVFEVDRLGEIRGGRDEAIARDVVHPLHDFRDAATSAGHFAGLAEERN